MIYYAKTHKGNVRRINEDSLYAPENGGFLAVVADGMGGHNAGEIASRITVETVVDALGGVDPEKITAAKIRRALSRANKEVCKDADISTERRGMGSTVTLAVFKKTGALIGHIGDSRAYLYRSGALTQITKDHSYVQMLIDNGFIAPEDAASHPQKNIITRAVGTEADVLADIYPVKMQPGDLLLLCTDGLNSSVADEKIARILRRDTGKAADRLVKAALDNGGRDNVSVVIAQMGGGGE